MVLVVLGSLGQPEWRTAALASSLPQVPALPRLGEAGGAEVHSGLPCCLVRDVGCSSVLWVLPGTLCSGRCVRAFDTDA